MTTVHDPLNTIAFVRAAAPLPDPWCVYLEIPFGADSEPHALVRAPIGTPLPEGAREIHRTILPTKFYSSSFTGYQPGPSGPSCVRGDVPLTTAERAAVDLQRRRWYEAPTGEGKPLPHLDAVLDDLARRCASTSKPAPETAPLFHEPTTTDPWVCPHHLTIGEAVQIAVKLPDSALTTIVVREPAPGSGGWTAALGIGSRMYHLRGSYSDLQKARYAALALLHVARRKAVRAMIEARGTDRWPLWGVSWRTYLSTITVVTAAHHQNAYDAYRDPTRVNRVDDPTLGGLVS